MSDNDWLKYNSSEYTVNRITYRNLEAQVLKNKEDIEAIDVSGLENDVEQLQTDVAGKQDKLTAGSNITIDAENEISATDTTYSAGSGISISAENEISATVVGIPEGGTTGQILAKASGTDYDTEWVTPLTKHEAEITLAAADWGSNTYVATVTGMTSTALVCASPKTRADAQIWVAAEVFNTAQGSGTLTFTCETTPTGNIDVNVAWLI